MIKEAVNKTLDVLTFVSSFSTLFCCALPAIFVLLGAGSVLVSLNENITVMYWVKEHRIGVFIFAGCMLTMGGFLQWRARKKTACSSCIKTRKLSRLVYLSSLTLYLIGGTFSFVLPHFIR